MHQGFFILSKSSAKLAET